MYLYKYRQLLFIVQLPTSLLGYVEVQIRQCTIKCICTIGRTVQLDDICPKDHYLIPGL